MKQEKEWERFLQSGSVSDYLDYCTTGRTTNRTKDNAWQVTQQEKGRKDERSSDSYGHGAKSIYRQGI